MITQSFRGNKKKLLPGYQCELGEHLPPSHTFKTIYQNKHKGFIYPNNKKLCVPYLKSQKRKWNRESQFDIVNRNNHHNIQQHNQLSNWPIIASINGKTCREMNRFTIKLYFRFFFFFFFAAFILSIKRLSSTQIQFDFDCTNLNMNVTAKLNQKKKKTATAQTTKTSIKNWLNSNRKTT